MPTQAKTYSGRTVEIAVRNAMDELGDDAEILSARRVRRGGVGGFFASEHVEGSARRVARARPLQQPMAPPVTIDLSDRAVERRAQTMAFEDHLQQMVLAVEHDEDAPDPPSDGPWRLSPDPREGRSGPNPRSEGRSGPDGRSTTMPRRLTDADLAPLPPAPPLPPPKPPAPIVAAPVAPVFEPVLEPVLEDRPARRGPRKTASQKRGPQWSITNLRRLGVAEEVLRRLVAPQPATDTAWTVALERAISDALPLGESRDRIAMHGYGAESAVTLLASALRGHRVDYIHLRERTAPASALELALAIRSCLCQ